MALDPKRGLKRYDWRWIPYVLLYVLMSWGHRFLPSTVYRWSLVIGGAAIAVWTAWALSRFVRRKLRERRAFREFSASGAPGRWPLGEPYAVELDMWDNGGRVSYVVSFDERGARFASRSLLGRGFKFEGVEVVNVHAAWIELVSGDESVRVVPRSYADRERLLWELAVRWSAAIDRGIGEMSPSAAPPAFVAPAATAEVDDLDRRMSGSGLASALAGPMHRANPAPPRKSGLGNGLFVAPPDDAK